MAICLGCGLELDATTKNLQVKLCPTGGIKCATPAAPGPDNCTAGLYVDQTLGCGLEKENGVLAIDVNSQAFNTPVAIGNANGTACPQAQQSGPFPYSACESPNCNGLVCTDAGLWAPPALPSINFSCGQIASPPPFIPLQNLRFNVSPQTFTGFDPFTHPDNDAAYGKAVDQIIIANAFEGDGCNNIDAMSWTAFNIEYESKPGELWRWSLWERICIEPTPADVLTTGCGTSGWALQAVEYIDTTNETDDKLVTVQINDNSTWRFGKNDNARMEAIITFNRLQGPPLGPAGFDNQVYFHNFQYRNMGHGYHYSLNQNCDLKGTTG